MKRDFVWAGVGGLVAFVSVCLLGAGGFPSRPKFQAVGVGIAASSTPGSIQTTGIVAAGGNVTSTGGVRAEGDISSGGTGLGAEIKVSSGIAYIHANNRTTLANGPLEVRGTPLTLNGAQMPIFAFGSITGSASPSCLINPLPANIPHRGLASCTRSAIGDYDIVFSGFTLPPVCTVTPFSITDRRATYTSFANGTGNVRLYSAAGAAVDGSVYLTCMGL